MLGFQALVQPCARGASRSHLHRRDLTDFARVLALVERWGWKVEGKDIEQAQAAAGQQRQLAQGKS